jgi:hypothetical protein
MRRRYIVSGILLIIPITLAVPVLVQEKRQVGVDVVDTPEDTITMFGKRFDDLDGIGLKYLSKFADHFTKPEELEAARPLLSSSPSGPDHEPTDAKQPQPSNPENPSPVSSSESLTESSPEASTESGYESMEESDASSAGPSRPASSTQSNHEWTGVHAPLSSPVFPTWFHPDHADHRLMGVHASRPNLGPTEFESDNMLVVEEPPSRPPSPTGSDGDHEYQVVHPPALPSRGSVSPIESDHEMVDVPPSWSPVR